MLIYFKLLVFHVGSSYRFKKKPNKMMEKHFETEYIIISLTRAQFKQNTSAILKKDKNRNI